MRMNDVSDWLGKQKERWREWLGWLILLCYAAILYWLSSVFWHVLKLFLFVSIFVGLSFVLAIAFKLLNRGEEKGDLTK